MRTAVLISLLALAGCSVGPNYERPKVTAPTQYRGDTGAPQSFGDAKWFDIFGDEKLKALIQVALVENYDVRIATQRIVAAQGALTASKAGFWPQVDFTGIVNRQRGPGGGISNDTVGGTVGWELDVWGRVRRQVEASKAGVKAAEFDQRAIRQIVVSEVAVAYFALRAYDAQLMAAQQSLAARKGSLKLVSARLEGGVTTKLEVDQAMSLVATAAAQIATIENQIEQTENYINLLLGRNPGPVERGQDLVAQKMPPEVPAGLPSALLDRRPDLQFAEQQLVAANAQVGVAKAAFFPTIRLTGVGGYQVFDLASLRSGSGEFYGFGTPVSLPIFDGGRRLGNYRTSKAQREEAILSYQKAVANSFRDVSDALVNYRKSKEFRQQQELLANTLRDQLRLANLRYRGGVSSYLEVLDTERQALDAEISLSSAINGELSSVVRVYRALGGGWQN